MLSGKKILLGVTGSISAYKSVYLTRLLVQKGAQVKVIMTPCATEFVSPISFATLSKNPVSVNFVNDKSSGMWENHVELGNWADLFLIAPATANTIAKMVNGIADNLLLATWLSNKTSVMLAPAMDHDMFHHFTTQKNLEILHENNVIVLDTEQGELASGIYGDGRLLEPEKIVGKVVSFFESKNKTSLSIILAFRLVLMLNSIFLTDTFFLSFNSEANPFPKYFILASIPALISS